MDDESQSMEVTTAVGERTVLDQGEPGDYSERKEACQDRNLNAADEESDCYIEKELPTEVNIFAIGSKYIEEFSEDWDADLWDEDIEQIDICVKTSFSQQMEHTSTKEGSIKRTIEDLVPKRYLKYWRVFEKHKSERLPERKPWDHAINLKPNFEPKKGPIYLLSPKEQNLQDKFLDEQLRKGYIQPSKSSMAAPFFFIAKKEKEALRPTQDYRYLNSGTIKNAYPLPLITDLLRQLRGASIFTKLDI